MAANEKTKAVITYSMDTCKHGLIPRLSSRTGRMKLPTNSIVRMLWYSNSPCWSDQLYQSNQSDLPRAFSFGPQLHQTYPSKVR